VAIGAASLQVSKAIHDGKTIKIDTATCTITLPAAAGNGGRYRFVTTLLAVAQIIKVQNNVDTMVGVLGLVPTTIAGAVTANSAEAAGGTDDTITMNGTTSGGIIGSALEFEDIAPGLWLVRGQLIASGVLTTPFSATV
jgi:hypothetical protein